jgi:hypothetical protein
MRQPIIDAELLRGPVLVVWNAIGNDLGDERISNTAAVECCIDADRLSQFAGEAGRKADAELTRAIEAHGYAKVLRALARAIRLV